MPQKMLVGDTDTVLLLPTFEISGVPQLVFPTTPTPVPFSAPTSALLNYYINTLTPAGAGAKWGGNITCAVIDDMKLELKDSSTKTIKTLCSIGNADELTYYNYDVQMNFLRDLTPTDTGSEFNLATTLTSAPDIAYIVAQRTGYTRTTAAAIGQEWHFYYAWTDYLIPAVADGDYQSVGETFIPKGLINFKYVLTA